MISVFSSSLVRKIDETAIDGNVTIGYSYMLKAGNGIRNVIKEKYPDPQSGEIAVICGKGNNGGDGYVAARLLMEDGYRIMCFSLCDIDILTGEAKIALEEFIASKGNVMVVSDPGDLSDLKNYIVIIDAVLGTGIHGDPRSHCAAMIDEINKSGVPVLSVDIPSGLDADSGVPGKPCISATYTITMGFPKTGMYFYPGRKCCGKLIIQELNYPEDCITWKDKLLVPEINDLRKMLPPRIPDGSKYDHGTALLLCGSRNYPGSAALACQGAMRSGCGMVHLFIPESIHTIIASKLTETVIHPVYESSDGSVAYSAIEQVGQMIGKAQAFCIGPGLTHEPQVVQLVRELVRNCTIPVLLDADGINAFKGNASMLKERTCKLVMTPHKSEWTRLFGSLPESPQEIIDTVRKIALEYQCTILLKGNPTLVGDAGGTVYILPFGNSSLAKAGSGDVLSGCIVSLMAMGASTTDAALLGAYLLGEAAVEKSAVMSEYAVTASDIIDELPARLHALTNFK
ncbi:MAG TPA: NAD(P)H-hydrate dehydratase [Chitinispirillaceae bacterium]|nr:NAD(P)H-hydrate dehydratase [Chitinispirillaceae bacterium]